MFNFKLKETDIFQAVRWEKFPIFKWAVFLKNLFLSLFIFILFIFFYSLYKESSIVHSGVRLFGFSIILLVLSVSFWIVDLFFKTKLKKPKLLYQIDDVISQPERYNLAQFLNFEAAKAVFDSIQYVKGKKLPIVNSSILLYFLLKNNSELKFIFFRALLDINSIKKKLKEIIENIEKRANSSKEIFSEDFQKSILISLNIAQKRKHQVIEVGDLISALSRNNSIFKKFLIEFNLKPKDIDHLIEWKNSLDKKIEEKKRFWEWRNLIKAGSLAKEWTAGYTLNLDRFSIDLSEMLKKQGFPDIIGHQEEIKSAERILARDEINNVLVVGEAGSGRKSIILALAKKSILGRSLPGVNFKRVVQLDLASLLAQIDNPEEVELMLDKIFGEVVSAGNIILFIDEFHNYVGLPSGSARPGVIDISGIISRYLNMSSFQLLAVATYQGLHKNIEQNPSILSLFEKVEVSEISEDETLVLLEKETLRLESKYKIFVSYPALWQIIHYCAKYLSDNPFPEKALNLLDEVMVYVSQKKKKVVFPSDVAAIVSEKIQIPVGRIETKEKEKLLNLEKLIHQRIINQEIAVKEVSSALRRARANVATRKGTIGSFLFMGPTGVGKTETSKALAEIYFGSEKKMIRLDMSEFQNLTDISRLIGSSNKEGLLTTPVRENPFSLVLLDEFEKAHPNILNLFLQVLDEGHLTDGLGRKIDFKNTIIIATSNAGYQIILKALKEKIEWGKVKERLLDYIFDKAIFRPELINRFDAVVVFKPLNRENLLDIAELLLRKLRNNLSQKQIDFVITDSLKEKIVDLSYSPRFGARNMQRVIQDNIGNVLARAILSGQIKRGDKIKINNLFKIEKI